MNQLILGDCLEVMQKMDSESVDLIYLDPPFFSNRNYEVIWGDKGEVRSFEDRWSGGIDHYIGWLKERVAEMHRLLKPTGSIYLHCDWHAFAEIKVYILDKIFGNNNFKNMITWKRSYGHGDSNKTMGRSSDLIFYYTKSNKYTLNRFYHAHDPKYINSFFKHEDQRGTYKLENLTSPNPRPNLTYPYKGYPPPLKGWRVNLERMIQLDNDNRLHFPTKSDGRIMKKVYLHELEGQPMTDLWTDLPPLSAHEKERIGYPTQKPKKLLERIINASSNEGDVVFDPFVGGGTTVVASDTLNRQWIGIDQSVQAIKISELRLNQQQGIFSQPFLVQLHKYDYDTLRYKDAFQFEAWIVERFGGLSNLKQRGDFGIDGKTRNGTPIQVKRSDGIGRNVIDNFKSSLERYDKALFEKMKAADEPVGYIIAFSFGKGAVQEVARLKNEDNITIKLLTVEEIVPIAKKPKLKVTIDDIGVDAKGIRELEFRAEAESEAGIEFYSYDFAYNADEKKFNPTVVLDREGHQSYKFKPGLHTIAVKAVDSEGLEAIEVIKLKVNGAVERE